MEEVNDSSPSVETLPILEAEHVYILMSQEYRISRNRRAEWFFAHLNSVISLEKKYKLDECTQELDVISVIPVNPPTTWNRATSHLFRYRICSKTVISFFSKKYRLVYCLDISPSAASVDVQSGMVLFDGLFEALKLTMEGITKHFYIPGSEILFRPKIYITVIAHAPVLSSIGEQVIVQGILLAPESLRDVVSLIFEKLSIIENKFTALTSAINESFENAKMASDRILGGIFDEEEKQLPWSSLAMTSDFGLVDLLQHALIALNLLPENSTAGLIIVTDGVLSVPDGGFLESILSQLRYNTVSCSFINLSSPFHPHLCYGMLSYADLMRFISSSTFGTYMTLSSVPELKESSLEMNVLHRAFLTWNFQRPVEDAPYFPPPAKPGEWSVRNKCFFSIRDMPIVKKQQFSSTLSVDYMKVLSCRLREGYTIKDVTMIGDEKIEIKLSLPWKFCIYIEYILTTNWPPVPKVGCVVSLEGPYDFLHDVTCLAKKPFRSYYRQLMVARFWASRKNLSESDKLLVHFNLFSSNSAYYNVPESLRNGVPLFYISSNTSLPGLQSSECGYTQFTQFWKPVCLLDTTIWQKWMHTHRIGIILEHDHPLPKHLHLPNSSGRFHVIQCRQAAMSLNTLLKDCSSFVLVENQNYIKLMYKNNEKIPFSFYIIRVTSKAPFVVLRIAFLVGTPGHLRHEEVSSLREKISSLTYPQRPKEPPKWRAPPSSIHRSFKRTWSDMPCCILLRKPIEKILIRYERVPKNFCRRLLPQVLYQNLNSPKITAAKPSTFGFRTTQQGPWGSSNKTAPEVFNTVARYLVHRRWIWAVQNPPHQSVSINCAAKILSTLTKLRLQEGFRFGCSVNGTVNMILELQMVNEWAKKPKESFEGGEEKPEPEVIPCILQYVIFPPTTSVLGIEEEEILDGDTTEEPNELYLVVEAWVEPQCGRILPAGPERSFLDNLEYQQVPDKIFVVDRGCITALITFEHLCLMCQDEDLSNSTNDEICGGEAKGKSEDWECEEGIQYLPFSFELNQILPKSQQAEVLFSMFNQDLATSYPVDADSNKFCDGANMTLYSLWMRNVTKIYDREVFLSKEENETILRLIIDRKREPEDPKAPMYDKLKVSNPQGPTIEVASWRCFVKKLSQAHLIITLFPTSYRDLKLLMLSEKGMEERAIEFLPESENYFPDHFQFEPVPSPADSPQTTPKDGKRNKKGKSSEQSRETPKNLSSSTSMSRKRSRVKSGGESGPASKRPLKRKNSVDNSFRFRTGSIDGFWTSGNRGQRTRYRSADQTLGPSFVIDTKRCSLTDAERSGRCPSASTPKFSDASSSPKTEVGKEGKPKYGALALPLYVYDASSSAITDHAIFRSVPTLEDLYVDCRVINDSCLNTGREEDEENHQFLSMSAQQSEEKHISPEPKSEDSEPISPESKAVLKNHCQGLETLFAKAYVRGLFESLQKGYFIHRNDVQVAVSMCEESLVEINLTEFIQTICGHMKGLYLGVKYSRSPESRTAEIEGCEDFERIHEFIKKRFTALLLSSFSWVADYSDIFYFSQHPLDLGWVNESRGDDSHSSPKTHHSEQEKGKSKMSSLSVSNNVSEDESVIANEGPERSNSLFIDEKLKSEPKNAELPLQDESHEWKQRECEREPFPLFLYITCTFKYGTYIGSFVIRNIPTCIDEIFAELQDSVNFDDLVDLEKLELIMDFVFLTIPPEIEEFEEKEVVKTPNLSSVSSQQTPKDDDLLTSKDNEIKEEMEPIKKFPSLPRIQLQLVNKTVEDIKWLLKDEITSFKWKTGELTEETLESVALHVEKSKGKPGCLVNKLPLTFPKNLSIDGFEKFKQRFQNLTIEGFRLTQVGSWFYLVDTLREQAKDLSDSQIFADKNESVFHQDEESSLKNEKVTEEMLRDSLERQSSFLSDGEDAEVAELAEKASRSKGLRRGCESEEIVETKDVVSGTPSLLQHHLYLTTPSQMSEISSLVGSLITNEDGYEGDGSDSGGEEEQQTDMDIRKTKLPPFWTIFYIGSEEITTYFHCRYNEEDLTVFHYSSRLREQISKNIFNLRRIVNQDLLLQQLHDTRQCSSLLEPENEDSEIWEMSPVMKKQTLHLEDNDRDPYLDLYEGRSAFSDGHFSCDVVWETKFLLHSRLRTVKSSMSRGIQTLQTTLIAIEVLNRRNMFVYRDSSGNVFYMRLYRVQEVQNVVETEKIDEEKRGEKEEAQVEKNSAIYDANDEGKELLAHMSKPNNELKTEDVVLLQVHGTTDAGFEIKEQLVQSLRNKLDDAVLDILSVTLDRNPHCKLTPEDVHFIQKPFSSYDNVLRYEMSTYAAQYIPAFAFYLHQNLLQFLHIPKYTDLKAVNHFQDFSMVNSEEFESMEKNVYLYNQSPEGTGSRGIACLAVAILNSSGGLYANASWNRPPSDVHFKEIDILQLSELIKSEEFLNESSRGKEAFVEIRIWKQGRINVDLLKNFVGTAMKHAIWDLIMEFHFLTAPIACPLDSQDTTIEPQSPSIKGPLTLLGFIGNICMILWTVVGLGASRNISGSLRSKVNVEERTMERRNSANLHLNESPTNDTEPPRTRSMSFSARKPSTGYESRHLHGRAPSPLTLVQGHGSGFDRCNSSKLKYQLESAVTGLNPYEGGESGRLHPFYGSWFKEWCEIGQKISVPSLRIVSIPLGSRTTVDITAHEVERIINSVAPDNTPRQFWRFGPTSSNFVAGGIRAASKEFSERRVALEEELKELRTLNLTLEFSKTQILRLFEKEEEMDPSFSGHRCLILSRNFVHWKSCTSSDPIFDSLMRIPEAHKNIYKFPPFLAGPGETGSIGGSMSSQLGSMERMSRVNSSIGLASLLNEPETIPHPLLIPRQRLLLAKISPFHIVFVFYNWSKESSERLVEQTKCLALWIDARSALLSSLLVQKAGLFHNQGINRSIPLPGLFQSGNPFCCGAADVDSLIRHNAPPKEFSTGRLTSIKKAKNPKALASFLAVFKNIKHASTLKLHDNVNLKTLGEQISQVRNLSKKDSENALFQHWLLRGPTASNVIGTDGIEKFKQAARIIHYCMTPIIFLQSWRTEVAATRDSSLGIFKRSKDPSESKRFQLNLRENEENVRSRHGSDTSTKSSEPVKVKGKLWGFWGGSSRSGDKETPSSTASIALGSKRASDKWHNTLCDSFIQEYIQYLQTHGFIHLKASIIAKSGNVNVEAAEKSRMGSGKGLQIGYYVPKREEENDDRPVHFLQKSLQGGILVFEIGFSEPFFYAKIYALEATRIKQKKSKKSLSINTLAFVAECERMKDLMHLHSFTYDFHLRSIHSYISGRQLIFKQGYHLTSFLDDFIKYYPKGPSFARNTVHIGLVTMQNVSTPSHILYNYILGHEKLYKMKVIRMNPESEDLGQEVVNEYILVHISSKKVTYKDMEDESQYDDFDLTLLIAHDAPPVYRPYSLDPSVLRLKYYIVLTSRREPYPKVSEERREGKLCIVNMPEVLSNSKSSSSWSPTSSVKSTGSGPSMEDHTANIPNATIYQETEVAVEVRISSSFKTFEGIREEQVQYMGYFSSHEQLMGQMVAEQVAWVEGYIRDSVSLASVDCRRELLWQRLLTGDDKKGKKDDLFSRETSGALSYWEFSELLELVTVKSLSASDSRLHSLLKQPLSFYQILVKQLTVGNQQTHRYFVAPDNSTHQVAIFSPNGHFSVVMLEINFDKHSADLSVLQKVDTHDKNEIGLEGEILNLIESVVNSFCYSAWANLL